MKEGKGHSSPAVSTEDSSEDRTHLLKRLLRGTASEILARLASNDPLRLYELGARRARERFFLLDADHLFQRLVARVAYVGARAEPDELDRPWLIRQADHAVERLIDEEREEERQSPFHCDPEDPRYPFLRTLLVEPSCARAASLAFNTLPERARKAFFILMLEKRSVEGTLALGLWAEEDLMRDSWRALGALGLHDVSGRPDPTWQLKP